MSETASAIAEFISFSIGDDRYGVDIMAVREIKGWTDIARLPNQPDYMRGVLNLRGAMVPIVDLRCRFGQGVTETHAAARRHRRADRRQARRHPCRPRARYRPVRAGKDSAGSAGARRTQADVLSGLISVDDGMIAVIALENLVTAQDVAAEAAQAA